MVGQFAWNFTNVSHLTETAPFPLALWSRNTGRRCIFNYLEPRGAHWQLEKLPPEWDKRYHLVLIDGAWLIVRIPHPLTSDEPSSSPSKTWLSIPHSHTQQHPHNVTATLRYREVTAETETLALSFSFTLFIPPPLLRVTLTRRGLKEKHILSVSKRLLTKPT